MRKQSWNYHYRVVFKVGHGWSQPMKRTDNLDTAKRECDHWAKQFRGREIGVYDQQNNTWVYSKKEPKNAA